MSGTLWSAADARINELLWDPGNPDATSEAGFGATVYDGWGRATEVMVHFRRTVTGQEYHVVMDGTGLEVGRGTLEFEAGGALRRMTVLEPFRLPLPDGAGPVIDLRLGTGSAEGGDGLDGIVLSTSTSASSLNVDGEAARWGFECARPAASPYAASEPARVACGVHATEHLTLRANLAPGTAIPPDAWDPVRPGATSNVRTVLRAYDADGARLDYDLYLRKESVREWSYHALLVSRELGDELGSGRLEFNANGSLKSATAEQLLRLPTHDGSPGKPVFLDFGTATDERGSGVDGVTAFEGGSYVLSASSDASLNTCVESGIVGFGEAPDFAQAQLAAVQSSQPSCAGRPTSAVAIDVNFAMNAPLDLVPWYPFARSNSASPVLVTTVYDAQLAAHSLMLYFRHPAASSWECHVLADTAPGGVEVGAMRWAFDANGSAVYAGPSLSVRFPLADGSIGPPIALDFGGTFQDSLSSWRASARVSDFDFHAEVRSDGAARRPCGE